MAAKGSLLKKEITDTILKTFQGSFLYNDGKEIRIPGLEDGQNLQIKVTLTCAKENVEQNSDNAIPGATLQTNTSINNIKKEEKTIVEPTQEEKDNVKRLADMLGL